MIVIVREKFNPIAFHVFHGYELGEFSQKSLCGHKLRKKITTIDNYFV